MGTNEFYYDGDKTITRKEAHALRDKSKLVVADRAISKTELGVINGSRWYNSSEWEYFF